MLVGVLLVFDVACRLRKNIIMADDHGCVDQQNRALVGSCGHDSESIKNCFNVFLIAWLIIYIFFLVMMMLVVFLVLAVNGFFDVVHCQSNQEMEAVDSNNNMVISVSTVAGLLCFVCMFVLINIFFRSSDYQPVERS